MLISTRGISGIVSSMCYRSLEKQSASFSRQHQPRRSRDCNTCSLYVVSLSPGSSAKLPTDQQLIYTVEANMSLHILEKRSSSRSEESDGAVAQSFPCSHVVRGPRGPQSLPDGSNPMLLRHHPKTPRFCMRSPKFLTESVSISPFDFTSSSEIATSLTTAPGRATSW